MIQIDNEKEINEKEENLEPECENVTPDEESESCQCEAESETDNTADEGSESEEADNESEGEKDSGKKKLFNRKDKKETKAVDELNDAMALLNDKYLRVCAEYDNFRKRSQKEKDALYGDIRSNVVSSFLPVYDNLVRALDAKTEDEAYRKGVEMIMAQFTQTLEKLGVEEIPALGEKFNPEVHNAVMHVDDEEKGENEIVEVFQKGFKLGDKVIRASMVKVAN